MKIVFIIQGEGRGHLTQAISLAQQLQSSNHTLVACLVGMIEIDTFTSIIENEIDSPVHYFDSPNLIYNQESKGLSLRKTITQNFFRIPKHNTSLNKIKGWMEQYKPDLIINFYDFLAGIYQLRFPFSAPPMVCIGHQYLLLHKSFQFPEKNKLDRFLVNLNSRITALRAKKMLALSFNVYENHKNIISVPPLLRNSVFAEPKGNFSYFVAYLTNAQLLANLAEWHLNHQNVEIHCFTKSDSSCGVKQLHKNLFVHNLDASKFLRLMANAKGLITTAGFESVCEAIYFGKPVMMVPVTNHFEQKCNAHDAVRYGAGIAQENFNLDQFIAFVESYNSPSTTFQEWIKEGKVRIIKELDALESNLQKKISLV
jgi:uncharacterized protein (TIGR00661 family)